MFGSVPEDLLCWEVGWLGLDERTSWGVAVGGFPVGDWTLERGLSDSAEQGGNLL